MLMTLPPIHAYHPPIHTYIHTSTHSYIYTLPTTGEQQKGKMGSSHPDYLDCLQYLAEFYLHLDRLTDAEPILTECLERRKHALGVQHPDTIHTLDTLANLYNVTGK